MDEHDQSLAGGIVFDAFEKYPFDLTQRRKYLNDCCGDNTTLAEAVFAAAEIELRIRADNFPFGVHDLEGTIIDDFRIGERIGSGGMGTVHMAEQQSIRRQVAIK